MLWVIGGALLFVWFVLKFLLAQTGYVHFLLIAGISLLVVQFAAARRTRFGRNSPDK
jgi:Flp pilus assembly protein TadB